MKVKSLVKGLSILVVGFVIGFVSFPFLTFADDRVTEGEAYGFVIGESKDETYKRVIRQIERGELVTLELGRGSSAAEHNRADPNEIHRDYNHWQLVVDPDWWNNVIYLSFDDTSLVEIWRFRVCCEGP